MTKLKYQDFIIDLASGSYYGVFIDDTGSPGLKSTPSFLHPERKSWVSVVIPPNQMSDVLTQLPEAINELQKLTGAKEFHFADIYGGKGDFKGVNLQARLGIFKFMVEIFRIYQFPIIVQTFDPHTLSNIRSRASLPDKLGPFNLKKQEDSALFFLLMRIKWHIEKDRKRFHLARVFVDEGFKRNGIVICFPQWKSVFVDGLICFASSSLMYPLQLADFAAFILNREQLLFGKETLSSLDRHLLEILSPIVKNFQNIEKKSFNINELEDAIK